MKKLVECGYSLFTIVKRELVHVVQKALRHCARFGTEHNSSAESSDSVYSSSCAACMNVAHLFSDFSLFHLYSLY